MTDEQVKDPLAIGLGSLAAGVGYGAACLTAAQIVAAILRGDLEPAVYRENAGSPLAIGVLVAATVGAVIAWLRSPALENIWQRGVISVLAAVGACLVGFLAALFDRFFGLLGLVAWLLLNIAFAIVATRWADKGKGLATP